MRPGPVLALATPKAYVIFDHQRRQHQAFDAAEGRILWTFAKGQGYPAWANPNYPLLDGTSRFTECECELNMAGGRSDEICLEQGKHPIRLLVLPGPSGKSLHLQWAREEAEPTDIPATALWHRPSREPPRPGNLAITAELRQK